MIPGNVEVTKTRDYGVTADEKSSELMKHLGARRALPFTAPMAGGAPAAFVCRNFTCERPVTTPVALEALLHGSGGSA